jgi:hypothetical protein
MFRFSQIIFVLCCLLVSGLSHAQEPVREHHQIGQSGEDYLRALRLRRVESDVDYYSPAGPPPPLDTTQKPKSRSEEGRGSGSATIEGENTVPAVIAGLVLIGIGYLFLRFGGGISVSMRQDGSNASSSRARNADQPEAGDGSAASLDEILSIRDRKTALVRLTRHVLAETVAAGGVLMQRSWTARDALRHVIGSEDKRNRLRTLVLASERVQFGGRDVSEHAFQEHVAGCRAVLGGTAR